MHDSRGKRRVEYGRIRRITHPRPWCFRAHAGLGIVYRVTKGYPQRREMHDLTEKSREWIRGYGVPREMFITLHAVMYGTKTDSALSIPPAARLADRNHSPSPR